MGSFDLPVWQPTAFEGHAPAIGQPVDMQEPPVCIENSIRVDLVTESPNVSVDGRAVMLLAVVVRLAVQVEEPT